MWRFILLSLMVVSCGKADDSVLPPIEVVHTIATPVPASSENEIEPVGDASEPVVESPVAKAAEPVDFVDWAALDGDPSNIDMGVETGDSATVIATGADSAIYSTPFCESRVIHTDRVFYGQRQLYDWCWDTVTQSVCTDKGTIVTLPADYWEKGGTGGWAWCPADSKGWYRVNVLINEALVP